MLPSSSGLGRHPFKVNIAGSNPAGSTTREEGGEVEVMYKILARNEGSWMDGLRLTDEGISWMKSRGFSVRDFVSQYAPNDLAAVEDEEYFWRKVFPFTVPRDYPMIVQCYEETHNENIPYFYGNWRVENVGRRYKVWRSSPWDRERVIHSESPDSDWMIAGDSAAGNSVSHFRHDED